MAWVLTTSLAALRRDLNTTFPSRDKASDGTIGDAAHQLETSGHNPDDTAGSKSEYTDADTKQEVRAFDADNDLRDPRGIDFQQVIDAILATPADRDRLMYVIHRRKIWRKRTGWKQETYTGSSPHDEHGHFSGDPAHDENDAPWTSVLAFRAGGSMELTSTVTEIALDGDVPTGWGAANPEPAQLPLSFVFGSLHRRLYLVYKGLVATYTEVRALRTNPPPATALSGAQLDDLANRVFDKLAAKLGDTLIGALTDPRAIEAYRQGANAAEDS